MGVDIEISTHQPEVVAGDTVEGMVTVNVSNSDGTAADELILELIGKASTRVMHTTTRTVQDGNGTRTVQDRHIITDSKEFLAFDIQLAAFGGRADAGTHSFPFAVTLPATLPSTMKESGDEGSSCAIAYGFKGKLHRPGLLKFDKKDEHEIKVVARGLLVDSTPVTVGPSTCIVKRCCCIKSGSMSLGFQADHTVLSRNERAGLIVVARNDSSASVKEMRIELVQDATWYARGYKERKRRVLSSMAVPGSDLGSVGRAVEKGADRGRSATEVANAARVELQEILAAGAGVHHEVVVPDGCSDTLNTGMIQIRHTLEVCLKTPWCISSPDVATPVIVQHMMLGGGEMVQQAGGGVGAGTDDVGYSSYAANVPYVTAVPVDSNVVGMGADGKPIPLAVPQHAVTIQLDALPPPCAPPGKG